VPHTSVVTSLALLCSLQPLLLQLHDGVFDM
jgi:hypothetical protein